MHRPSLLRKFFYKPFWRLPRQIVQTFYLILTSLLNTVFMNFTNAAVMLAIMMSRIECQNKYVKSNDNKNFNLNYYKSRYFADQKYQRGRSRLL